MTDTPQKSTNLHMLAKLAKHVLVLFIKDLNAAH